MKYFTLFALLLTATLANAQSNYWSSQGTSQKDGFDEPVQKFHLNLDNFLQKINSSTSVTVQIPNQNGKYTAYNLIERSNFSDELAEKFPSIKSYRGKAVNNPHKNISLSISEDHISGIVFNNDHGSYILERTERGADQYLYYSTDEINLKEHFKCYTEAENINLPENTTFDTDEGTFRTFKLAVTTDGEFSQYHGGSVESSLAAVNDLLSFINPVYERDLSVHLNLIDNEETIIFTDPDNDPYEATGTPPDSFISLSPQVQSVMTDSIGEANYDLGIIFTYSDNVQGGYSYCIGCVCEDEEKGGALAGPTFGDPEGYSYAMTIAHEMGHQFGANHTFSRDEFTDASREPGSGSTIMAYPGATQFWDVENVAENYFHHYSIQQISQYLPTTGCATTEDLNNSAPAVDAGSDYSIPNSTAFRLEAEASDPDDDALTYSWEQADDNEDQSNTYHFPKPASTDFPNYRVFPPREENFRYFPAFNNVLKGSLYNIWEMTPTVGRDLHFRVQVRDNNPEGGQTASDMMEVNVSNDAGPFQITSIDENGGFPIGADHTLEWDVSGTDASPIGVSNVNVLLSTDGGETFEMLVENTANDGEEEISMPGMNVDNAYIMVEAVDNIFYAMSPEFSVGSQINYNCNQYVMQEDSVDVQSLNNQIAPTALINVDEPGTITENFSIDIDLEQVVINNLIIIFQSPQSGQNFLFSPDFDCSISDPADYSIRFSSKGDSPYAHCEDLDGRSLRGTLFNLDSLVGDNRSGNYVIAVASFSNNPSGKVTGVTFNFCDREQAALNVESNVDDKSVKIYPNPSDGLVNISTPQIDGKTALNVFSITGEKVLEKNYNSFGTQRKIDLSHLSSGVYLVKIQTDKKTMVKKIVIE